MTSADQAHSEVKQLADVLLDDVERIAACGLARMQEVLPSYAKVPAEKLSPVTSTITRHLLEAVRDQGADRISAEDHFRLAGEVRSRSLLIAARERRSSRRGPRRATRMARAQRQSCGEPSGQPDTCTPRGRRARSLQSLRRCGPGRRLGCRS